jgi:hypothetical protein
MTGLGSAIASLNWIVPIFGGLVGDFLVLHISDNTSFVLQTSSEWVKISLHTKKSSS